MTKFLRVNPSGINSYVARSGFDSVFEQIEKDFFNFWKNDPFTNVTKKASYPKVDVWEENDKVIIEATVSGLERDDITVEYNGEEELLTISAKTSNKKEDEDRDWRHREIHRSSFTRSFHVDDETFLVDKIDGKVDKGVLRIEIPKREVKEKKETKKINIQ